MMWCVSVFYGVIADEKGEMDGVGSESNQSEKEKKKKRYIDSYDF